MAKQKQYHEINTPSGKYYSEWETEVGGPGCLEWIIENIGGGSIFTILFYLGVFLSFKNTWPILLIYALYCLFHKKALLPPILFVIGLAFFLLNHYTGFNVFTDFILVPVFWLLEQCYDCIM